MSTATSLAAWGSLRTKAGRGTATHRTRLERTVPPPRDTAGMEEAAGHRSPVHGLEFPRFFGHLSACVRKPRKDGLNAEVASAVSA